MNVSSQTCVSRGRTLGSNISTSRHITSLLHLAKLTSRANEQPPRSSAEEQRVRGDGEEATPPPPPPPPPQLPHRNRTVAVRPPYSSPNRAGSRDPASTRPATYHRDTAEMTPSANAMRQRCGQPPTSEMPPRWHRETARRSSDAANDTSRQSPPAYRSPRRPPRTRSPAALRTGRRLVTAETCDDAVHASASLRIGRCPRARTRRGKRNSRGRERLCLYLKCSRDETEMKPKCRRDEGGRRRGCSLRALHTAGGRDGLSTDTAEG